jgi:hypothetical protein
MTTSVDNFKSKLNDYRNQLKKLKSEYKLDGAKINLTNEQKGALKFNLQKLLRDLSHLKKEYLDSNYRAVLSEFEDSNRKDELGEVIEECETLIKTYCKGDFECNIKEEDYKDPEFGNPYEQIQYQEKKLKEQDKIIDNIISINNENKVIGKEVKTTLKDQNNKIDKISKSLDETNRDAKRLNDKFVDMILDSSFWKLYCLIGFLALVLIWIWL